MSNDLNPEIDTTKFVNIDDKKFVFHINKQPREVEAGEEKIMPVYVAQIGAKHLVDKVLQEKHNVKDTLRDTDLRKSLFAQILPEMAEQRDIKPLKEEDFQKKVSEELDRQKKVIEGLAGVKNDKISELEAEVEKLKKEIAGTGEKKKLGRPPNDLHGKSKEESSQEDKKEE